MSPSSRLRFLLWILCLLLALPAPALMACCLDDAGKAEPVVESAGCPGHGGHGGGASPQPVDPEPGQGGDCCPGPDGCPCRIAALPLALAKPCAPLATTVEFDPLPALSADFRETPPLPPPIG